MTLLSGMARVVGSCPVKLQLAAQYTREGRAAARADLTFVQDPKVEPLQDNHVVTTHRVVIKTAPHILKS
jgi:hypothetical protein